MTRKIKKLVLLFLGVMIFFSCKKERFITDSNALVNISADSIKFDTVFTSTSSITQSFKIRNDNSEKLMISKIKLMGGSTSSFRININGNPVTEENNIEVAPFDSIYIFIAVTINPNNNSNPFIVNDSILISYNGNNRFVQLEAYGQNAHYLNNQMILQNQNWVNDLPYVILGKLTIDTNAILTIDAGCKIYLHSNANFFIDGTLIVNGEKNNEVVFTGDRLDEYYKDLPGSWMGINYNAISKNNLLNYAIIKNAKDAISVKGLSINSNPKLTIHQCIINNAQSSGIYSNNGSVAVDNSIVSNCGSNVLIELGGEYTFTNCTIASYANAMLPHSNPVLKATNFSFPNGILATESLSGNFNNCIFWGEGGVSENEVSIEKEGSNPYNVTFDHCLYKATEAPVNANIISSFRNIAPAFDSINVSEKYYDFQTTRDINAPGVDAGALTIFTKDLNNLSRMVGGSTDIGCYEKQ